ncbi:helicase-related protein [Brevibacterium linens]|uniref:helicase-related protein n=1 Tax=Brevibacterium linens TaxID=1703 RepID=UPI001F493059|nr:helicase-related protein [Brevibacterium linens]
MTDDLQARYAFRSTVVDRLVKDVYGPGDAHEILEERPLDRYIVGILWPETSSETEAQIVNEPDSEASNSNDAVIDSPVSGALVKTPVSAGMTFTVNTKHSTTVTLTADAARYVSEKISANDEDGGPPAQSDQETFKWRREQARPEPVVVDIPASYGTPEIYELVDDALQLYVLVRHADENGNATVTAVLRNTQVFSRGSESNRDAFAWFQVGLAAETSSPAIVDRRSLRTSVNSDPDLQTSDLLYRHEYSFGTGHGCAVHWDTDQESNGAVSRVRTEFIPRREVPRAKPNDIEGVDLRLSFLSRGSREEVVTQLEELCAQYELWIAARSEGKSQDSGPDFVPPHLQPIADTHLENAREALSRMRRGVDLLSADEQAFAAFKLANQAMHIQRSRQDWVRGGAVGKFELQEQKWRPFQIAFVLLNLPSLTDRYSQERDIADLLWFPAGGGKTEAYLGLIAYLVVLRRLRDPEVEGTAVIMRYTLRLLTIQQFERAAMLMCSLEHLRRKHPETLGSRSFSIGLWVGAASTPNSLVEARRALNRIRNGNVVEEGNPKQLHTCPWCGTKLTSDDYIVEKTRDTMVIRCGSEGCEFRSGLPAYVVDEDIYLIRPELVIGTVDKFARMAWDGRVATIFGRVEPRDIGPDLIVQDELHLISGPLGSTVGLFESAVDLAAGRKVDDGHSRPKLVASTATIRRADGQIRSVFDRESRLFPPPGLNPDQSFFASPAHKSELGTREYIGLMAPGTSHASLMVRVYASLLNSVEAETETPEEIRDAYWTLIGYFNSLRVLGSAYLQVNDDVATRLTLLAKREHRESGREVEVHELTSRRSSSEIPETLKRLETSLKDQDRPLDVVLATNMISVGLDVDRLGLMTVMGQPPSSAEYIQATSRVGRKFPGLVVAIYNDAKSRDRSHYEGFADFHGSLYRAVEATSATPFADRSRDRGLHAAFVSAVRMTVEHLRDDKAVRAFRASDQSIVDIETAISERSFRVSGDDDVVYSDTKQDLAAISREWHREATDSSSTLNSYVDRRNPERALLIDGAEALSNDVSKNSGRLDIPWATPQSMRDVDAESSLFKAKMSSGHSRTRGEQQLNSSKED